MKEKIRERERVVYNDIHCDKSNILNERMDDKK